MADLSMTGVIAALRTQANGMTLRALHSTLGLSTSTKTLQRFLGALSEQGLVQITGRGKGTRYFAATPSVALADNPLTIPLSLRAKELLAFVEQPLELRPKAGYKVSFLRSYLSNESSYLSSSERSHLLSIGQTARQQDVAGTYARHMLERLLIDLSYNSSRLEGNTYTLLDTQLLIAKGQIIEEKTAAETQMILNHKDAIEFLVEGAQEVSFNRSTLLNLHAILSNNLLPDPAASGRLRTFAVGIAKSSYLPPGMPQQVEEYFDLFVTKAQEIRDPFEQAFFAMVHIPYLQPFEDVNKRVSRLVANIPLIRLNLAPLSFIDVPRDLYIKGLLGVYERAQVSLLKDVFLYAYERSASRYGEVRQTLGEPDPFRLRYRDGIRQVISEVVGQALPPAQAQEHLLAYARQLREGDRETFVNVVETELLALHDGNFARYRILPSQFAAWKSKWKVTSPG
jgi:hypothetical protein